MHGLRRASIGCLVCLCLALGVAACGGSKATSDPATHTVVSTVTRASWAAQTQQLCVQKSSAIARLGGVDITYAGIARDGVPAVKTMLDRYLVRLVGIVHSFYQRQLQIPAPASVAAPMAAVGGVYRQSQASTMHLIAAVSSAQNAAQLTTAFRTWIGIQQRLTPRSEALVRELDLPGCEATVSG